MTEINVIVTGPEEAYDNEERDERGDLRPGRKRSRGARLISTFSLA
jgi:hypothetical protein